MSTASAHNGGSPTTRGFPGIHVKPLCLRAVRRCRAHRYPRFELISRLQPDRPTSPGRSLLAPSRRNAARNYAQPSARERRPADSGRSRAALLPTGSAIPNGVLFDSCSAPLHCPASQRRRGCAAEMSGGAPKTAPRTTNPQRGALAEKPAPCAAKVAGCPECHS